MYYGSCDSGSYLQIFIHGESGDTYIMDVDVCIMAAVTVAHTCMYYGSCDSGSYMYVLWQL